LAEVTWGYMKLLIYIQKVMALSYRSSN